MRDMDPKKHVMISTQELTNPSAFLNLFGWGIQK